MDKKDDGSDDAWIMTFKFEPGFELSTLVYVDHKHFFNKYLQDAAVPGWHHNMFLHEYLCEGVKTYFKHCQGRSLLCYWSLR